MMKLPYDSTLEAVRNKMYYPPSIYEYDCAIGGLQKHKNTRKRIKLSRPM